MEKTHAIKIILLTQCFTDFYEFLNTIRSNVNLYKFANFLFIIVIIFAHTNLTQFIVNFKDSTSNFCRIIKKLKKRKAA